MVDLPQRKDFSLRRAFNLLLEVEVSHRQGLEEGDLCRRVFLRPESGKEGPRRFQEIEHCNPGQYSKSDMHGNQAAPVTRRVLAEGVWDGYLCIPQKRPHSLDRESFTMMFQSHVDSSQRHKSEHQLVAILKHVTPFSPAFSPIGDYHSESPFHISDRCVRLFLPSHLFQTLRTPYTMAAAISALNAKIRSRPVLSYFCSTRTSSPPPTCPKTDIRRLNPTDTRTDFWGPASNFGIPIAAVLDTQKDPAMYVALPTTILPSAILIAEILCSISGRMTAALMLYSGTFMRYAFAVTPANYLLFACHFVNFGAQSTQGYRYLQYWK